MVRPFFFYGRIHRLQPAAGLEKLLERRLVVRKAEIVVGFRPNAIQFRLQYTLDDELASPRQAAVQVHGCQHRFHGI